MKILVTGACGMLAKDIIEELRSDHEVIAREHPELDICDREKVLAEVREIGPEILVNCAAFTAVDQCETEEERALQVNGGGVANLVQACNEQGVTLYHISTDFIFDGTKGTPYVENDAANPLSAYARSKYAGEQEIFKASKKYVIVRTSWLFGKNGNNFVETMLRLSDERDVLKVVDDQRGCPTYTVDLARAVKVLIHTGAEGVFHMSNSGECSWCDFAKKIMELSGAATRVDPISAADFGSPAQRPQYSVLNCDKLKAATGFQPRHWEETLKEYLHDRGKLRQSI